VKLRCAISPDADDRFMLRAVELGLVDTEGLDLELVTRDTDQLNQLADGNGPDVTAISIAHYPRVSAHYRLLPHGGSVGRGYGPVVIAPPGRARELDGLRIAVPGLTTTAHLVLSLVTRFEPVVIPIVPMTRVFDALAEGRVDAALLIHEGRLSYEERGYELRLDLGVWWAAQTRSAAHPAGLPLPLGGNVIRRDLPPDVLARANRVLRASIAHALDHRDDAIDWLLAGGTALRNRAQVDHYLSLYANADTLDYGADGRAGIVELLRRGAAAGLVPKVAQVELVDEVLPV